MLRSGEQATPSPPDGGLLTTVEDLFSWTESLEAGSLAGSRFVKLMAS